MKAIVSAIAVALIAVLAWSYFSRPSGCLYIEPEMLLFLGFTEQGKTVTAVSSLGNVSIFDVDSTQETTFTLTEFGNPAGAMALSSDRQLLAAWHRSGTIALWHLPSGRAPQILHEQAGKGECLAFSPDNRTLAVGGEGLVMLLDVSSGRITSTWAVSGLGVSCLAFAPDGQTLAYGLWGDRDNPIKIWNLRAARETTTVDRDGTATYSLAFSPDGKVLACGNQGGGRVELWDLESVEQLPPLRGHSHNAVVVAFAPDGNTLASGSMDRTAIIWDWKAGKALAQFSDCDFHTSGQIAFSSDSGMVAFLTRDAGLRLGNVRTGQERIRQNDPAQ